MHEGGENLFEDARFFVGVVVLVAGFMRAVARGGNAPGSATAKFPEDAFDEDMLIEWGAIRSLLQGATGEAGLDEVPLFVGEVHYLMK